MVRIIALADYVEEFVACPVDALHRENAETLPESSTDVAGRSARVPAKRRPSSADRRSTPDSRGENMGLSVRRPYLYDSREYSKNIYY